MLRTFGTEISQLCVLILEQSIAAAARALTKDVMTDFMNYRVHRISRVDLSSNFDAMGYQVVFIAQHLFVSPNRPGRIEPFFRTAGFPSLGNPVLDFPENGNPIDPISLGEGWLESIIGCGVMSLNCGSGRIRVQFVIACGQSTRSNETTSND